MNEDTDFLTIDDYLKEPISITKPIRLIELFSGFGSQAMAMKRLGVKFEHHFISEIDKFAIASYNKVHDTDFETSDIRNVHAEDLNITDTDKYCYILFYSFPCQDLSIAGLGRGLKKGDGTRSGLLWEVERILKECNELPQVLIMENVTQVHNQKNMPDFKKWLEFLESLGYSNYWQDLNAKDFGIPQNRDRCFMVSLLGNYVYHFPKPIERTKKLKDLLEDEVADKFYLNSEKANQLVEQLIVKNVPLEENEKETIFAADAGGEYRKKTEVARTLMARDYKGLSGRDQDNVVVQKIAIRQATNKGYIEMNNGGGNRHVLSKVKTKTWKSD